MDGWDFLVDMHDLSRTMVAVAPVPSVDDLDVGETLLEIERFSLTANNITYAVFGDQLGYWRFFPASGEWGRIPVWGFAKVVASRAEDVAEGLRLYGYWPMSTHLVARLEPAGGGYVDRAEHRAALPPAYNGYSVASETPRDDLLALLRPLFTTSFLLDDWLSKVAPDATPILSSASSRTALGLAWLLKRRGRPAVGLTSNRNAAFLERLGFYERIVTYDAVAGLALDGPVAFVDMAGDAQVQADVHARFAEELRLSAVVGSTHHEARGGEAATLPGPTPTFFFAPDRLVQRRRDWGAAELDGRSAAAMDGFMDDGAWLAVRHHCGPDQLSAVYHEVLAGEARPDEGHIVLPTGG